ncbi:SocA family protein [Hyphomonas sp. WL0036]|uniref:Panacea domain-containing protein n=1 Tax=Hyphomonas sediminis TaxID=2866160 RepID=UPI001C7F0D88|nr:Panacea domain-containing protein [Hyphomonas sediminis]MBY9067772.1 SocA family protein [Hyphomonas sediminis]
MPASFDPKKSAQVAAFFCLKAGGKINVLKLVKLMYLSDRLSMERSGSPVVYDKFVSMKFGPVVSETYNLIKGETESEQWDDLIVDLEKHTVGLARKLTDDDSDQLSRFEERILEEVWATFGDMDRFKLAELTHKICPEWEDPGDSSKEIPRERIFKFLKPETADEMARRLDTEYGLRAALSRN